MSASAMPTVVVVGSLNLDLVARVPRLPRAGETLLADSYRRTLGGKGANQAVAAARHGVAVTMIGCVGDDGDGAELTAALAAEGVDVGGVLAAPRAPSGVAHIAVDAGGDNTIIVVPGANGVLEPAAVRRALDRLPQADVILIQLEIPLASVAAAAATDGPLVVLNPAPARDLGRDLLRDVDVIVPNLPELTALTGGGTVTALQEVAERARVLGEHCTVVVTLGERGAMIVDDRECTHLPAPVVEAIDTTAAGDAFCGSLAARLAAAAPLQEAARHAVLVGALATTRHGALEALPTRDEIATAAGRDECSRT
jgi:ribokinase